MPPTPSPPRSAEAFARGTTYAIPTTGPLAHRDHRDFCTPVYYNVVGKRGEQAPEYGRWVDDVPGPRARIPWLQADERADAANDAVPADSANMLGTGLRRVKAAPPGNT